jgi:hypothetical protein
VCGLDPSFIIGDVGELMKLFYISDPSSLSEFYISGVSLNDTGVCEMLLYEFL